MTSGGYAIDVTISIHSLVKRETECGGCSTVGHNFNPLPRKEGDKFLLASTPEQAISIHSLVKRETVLVDNLMTAIAISIHSLVKRETGICQFPFNLDTAFQSTPS